MSKKLSVLYFSHLLFLCAFFKTAYTKTQTPRLTIVFVIDQFAYHYIPKISKHFRYGLHDLLKNGIFYTNAYHAHGIPETTTGHHALSTATLAENHGAVLNQWIGADYERIDYDEDNSKNSAVFVNDNETGNDGKSCTKTMVDGISDQFVLQSIPTQANKVFALSLKSHPAIATANRLGKAIWFDDARGIFTSSKKYFSKLPSWLSSFNKKYGIPNIKRARWKTMYPSSSAAYDYDDIKNYDYAAHNFSLITLPEIPIDRTKPRPFQIFAKSPHGSKALFALAKQCIEKNFGKESDHMLLWISISTLDLIGHFYGPDSFEAIDTLYHIDYQIRDFMNFAKRRIGEKKCLFVLTGDHGIPPIPELSYKRGITFAKRIMAKPLMNEINAIIAAKYNVQEVLKAFEPTYFVLHKEALDQCDHNTRDAIITHIKKLLREKDGIKEVWTTQELRNMCCNPTQPEGFYKAQLYNHRCGDIMCMPQPYCLITHYPTGTSHLSPYEYDTHVPLVMYQKCRFEKKIINERIWMPQVSVSLAHILNISKPSASTYQLLPGLL